MRGLVILLLALAGDALAAELIVLRGDGAAVRFSVETATTPEARATGLMHRATLAPRHGMWFDFGQEREVAMWMKNTLLALDMLFVDADGVVRHLHRGAVPGSLETIKAPRPVRYVLEIAAGEAARYALGVGDRARLLAR